MYQFKGMMKRLERVKRATIVLFYIVLLVIRSVVIT